LEKILLVVSALNGGFVGLLRRFESNRGILDLMTNVVFKFEKTAFGLTDLDRARVSLFLWLF
jgi:hypothetical protein